MTALRPLRQDLQARGKAKGSFHCYLQMCDKFFSIEVGRRLPTLELSPITVKLRAELFAFHDNRAPNLMVNAESRIAVFTHCSKGMPTNSSPASLGQGEGFRRYQGGQVATVGRRSGSVAQICPSVKAILERRMWRWH